MIEAIVKRFGNPYEAPPPQHFREPHENLRKASELVAPDEPCLLSRLATDQTPNSHWLLLFDMLPESV